MSQDRKHPYWKTLRESADDDDDYVDPDVHDEPTYDVGKFILGPIPLPWLQRALELSEGKATVAVALSLLFKKGFHDDQKTPQVDKATRYLGSKFRTGRDGYRAGLRRLEKAGLVSVTRGVGRAPKVIILPFKPS